MKIAFIGHSYHQLTRSTAFLVDLLQSLGPVRVFADESWRGQPSTWAETFDATEYDVVVIFQVESPFQYIPRPHPNLVFVPMYDSMLYKDRFHWKDEFNRARILCFSSTLHREVSRYTSRLAYFKYYIDPNRYPAVTDYRTLRGFFWKRVARIDERVVAGLCERTTFDQFTLHAAPDPGAGGEPMAEFPVRSRQHRRTAWFERPDDYLAAVAEHNIFFASRPFEGIGMGVLEAMAMGLCVVAPATPTHDEYISNGATGLLYSLDRGRPINFTRARDLGARARESVEQGFKEWLAVQDELLNFISGPDRSLE
jgi:hypothetical protein